MAAPIGPVNVEIIRFGLRSGFNAALFTGLGAVTADTLYLVLFYFGLGAVISHPAVKISIWIFGSLVLFYLGITCIREALLLKEMHQASPIGKRHFFSGFILAASSPMNIVWWAGIFGAVMAGRPASSLSLSGLFLNMAIPLGCFFWVLGLSTVLHYSKRFITLRMLKTVTVSAGIMLCCFGVWFAFKLVSFLGLI